ncbi:unknown [Clostridium sp. CAG:411]|jgi:hypothetical protein|nr:hypothetical protein [Lachnospiraceae bacterium]CDE44119.1 unknown [Clostridium sp. CAG:411]
MKQYEEPILIEKEKKREGRSLHKKGTKQICPKEKNQYAADWTCANCQHCIHQEGWSWLNDRCSIA